MIKTLEFDLTDPADKENYEHALVAADYYSVLENLIDEINNGIDTGFFYNTLLSEEQVDILKITKQGILSDLEARGIDEHN